MRWRGAWDLLEYQNGVRYHPDHVWRILCRLNWICQRPTGRVLERDQEAIGLPLTARHVDGGAQFSGCLIILICADHLSGDAEMLKKG